MFAVFDRPFMVLRAVFTKRPLDKVVVRTPTGKVEIALRNFESLKTTFSIFCRRDYPINSASPHFFLDIGSNIGIAACFFLTRHPDNRVLCYEPDERNLGFLRQNMAQFGGRARIVEKAVGPVAGGGTLFRSEDGKYTSLIESAAAVETDDVEIEAFDAVLDTAVADGKDVIVKVDIEGLETALVQSVDFARYPAVTRLIVESLECSALISRPHERRVRNGYVEDLSFV